MYTILQQDMLSNFYVILKHNLHIIMNKQIFTQCGYASTACAYCNSRIRSFFSTSCYTTVCPKIHSPVIYSNYILFYESRRGGLIILLLLMIHSTRQKTRHMAENVANILFQSHIKVIMILYSEWCLKSGTEQITLKLVWFSEGLVILANNH